MKQDDGIGLLEGIIGIGIVGYIVKQVRKSNKEKAKAAAEEEHRKNTPCEFCDGISESDFETMAVNAGKPIKRLLKLYTEGPIVYGTVRSQSAITEWNFIIDFNDFGHITGQYWLTSENKESKIPAKIAEDIKKTVQNKRNNQL